MHCGITVRNRRKLTFIASKRPYWFLLIFLFLLLILEEWRFGLVYRFYFNTYRTVVYRPIDARRTASNRQEIAIVSIVHNNSNSRDYLLAQSTTRCYSRLHGYPLIEINLERDVQYLVKCSGTDFMFLRHCILMELMSQRPEIDWFLFLDADMGVVNPNHLLEEYANPRADLIFYDRLFNYEIMAGSYFVKNTPFGRSFLNHWSEYEKRVDPQSFHGTDNGAIHEVFLDYFCLNCSRIQRRRCADIWRKSTSFHDLYLYESCARAILGVRRWYENQNGSLLLLSNARGYWARDTVHTNSRWSSEDFIMHMWKEKYRNAHIYLGWFTPFAVDPLASTAACDLFASAQLNWQYKDTFITPVNEIRKKLSNVFGSAYQWHLDRIKTLEHMYPIDEYYHGKH
ncbi:hypothetical protein M3Y98_00833000 [Aphelenchoides besseyi]|nr:hypothetical protein M3Y98_00833000 [Aphelenchoides besseyi]